MLTENSLITAYLLNGQGSGRKLSLQEVLEWSPDQGVLWVHLDINNDAARNWLTHSSGLDAPTASGFIEGETRPRTVISKQGIFQILRGVNHNPGSEPEDMVSVRLWIDEHRIITARRRFLLSEVDIRDALEKGVGPRSPSEFLLTLNDTLTLHIAEVIEDIDEQVDQLETDILNEKSSKLRPVISDLRRQAISIRRYLAPQREALYRLTIEETSFLSHDERMIMREITDRVVRYIEDLDSSRDKATIIHEQLANQMAEQLNKQMLALSIVAVVFMPITFLTGLLGVNIKGIPAADNPSAFLFFCAILLIISLSTISTFWFKKWI